jgi:hypothetical protein
MVGCVAAYGQMQPQFIWQGEVDGTSVLFLHGKRLRVENRKGLPVQKQSYRFYQPLPESRQNVRMEVRESRGAVQIIQQPDLENGYTAAVMIQDLQPGASTYSLALYWDVNLGAQFSDGRSELPPPFIDRLNWSGQVQGDVTVECRGHACTAHAANGGSVAREHTDISRRLPDRDVPVSLRDKEGRGKIELLEQPSRANHYTAKVRIGDDGAGPADYSFTLTWERPDRHERDHP